MLVFSLLLILSCAVKNGPVDFNKIRQSLPADNCLEVIKQNMRKADCPQLSYKQLGEHDTMFRCHKDDKDRGKFWDNYIFRVSPVDMQYLLNEDKKMVLDHTICVDGFIRVEAYPPEGI